MDSRERLGKEEQEQKFPLVLWQETPEFLAEYKAARQRLAQISQELNERGFQCGGSLSWLLFDEDDFRVWLNDSRPLYGARLSLEDASRWAKKYGDTGWWKLDDLAEFIEGRGIIFEKAMRDLGFRPHKKIPGKWARIRPDEKYQISGHWEDPFVPVKDEELQRLQALLVIPNNHEYAPGKIFYLEVGGRGLIYVSLWVDPFAGTTAETIGELAGQLGQHGHINREQQGFTIKARNISLAGEEAIHILAEASGKEVETVWPRTTDRAGLFQLAGDLNNKLKAISS